MVKTRDVAVCQITLSLVCFTESSHSFINATRDIDIAILSDRLSVTLCYTVKTVKSTCIIEIFLPLDMLAPFKFIKTNRSNEIRTVNILNGGVKYTPPLFYALAQGNPSEM